MAIRLERKEEVALTDAIIQTDNSMAKPLQQESTAPKKTEANVRSPDTLTVPVLPSQRQPAMPAIIESPVQQQRAPTTAASIESAGSLRNIWKALDASTASWEQEPSVTQKEVPQAQSPRTRLQELRKQMQIVGAPPPSVSAPKPSATRTIAAPGKAVRQVRNYAVKDE